MFKFVVLAALFAVAAARPGVVEPVVYSSPIVQESVLANVGSVVRSVPTAVSHQSQTIVHGHNHVVEPVVAPVVRTYAAAPVISAAPVAVAHSVPVTYAAAAPVHVAAAPVHIAASSPLTYTAQTAW